MAPSRASGRLHLGTSGFGYDEWKGRFYPADIKAKDMLAFYASRFSSVEINYTFRSLLTEKTAAAWTAATPGTFVFALKAHMRMGAVKLDDVRKTGAMFAEAAAPLGARTGPVLLQIPKRLESDAAALEAYLGVLPKPLRFALEFTADGWGRVRSLVEARGMGRCVADTDEAPAPDDAAASGAFAYLRLRRTKYSAADLAKWADRIGETLAAGRDVHCYFRHEDTASGPRFADALEKAIEKRSGLAAVSRRGRA